MKPTQEQVIAWAQEAGLITESKRTTLDVMQDSYTQLETAYTLAYEAGRKDENEACAKVCDEKVDAEYATGKVDHNEMGWTQYCAMAIRARRKE